jgi:hypothetical protein
LLIPDKKTVCIVRLMNGVQHPAVRFQVTVDPDLSKDGYIRFGAAGDELAGWFRLEDIYMEKLLGEPAADGKTFKVVNG